MYKAKKAIHRSHILVGCEYESEEQTVEKVLTYLKGVVKVSMNYGELEELIRHERRKHIYYNHHHGDKGTGTGKKELPVSNKAKAHENRMSLALEAQRMFDELNSQRKRNGELTRDLEQATKQVAMYAKALSGGGGRAGLLRSALGGQRVAAHEAPLLAPADGEPPYD